jgi:hypothetical protein
LKAGSGRAGKTIPKAGGGRRLPSAVIRSTPESVRVHSFLQCVVVNRCFGFSRKDQPARSLVLFGMRGL